MEYNFHVQLTTGKIFHFLFLNAYTNGAPLLSTALAVILIFFGIFKGGWVYCFFGILFLLTAPFVLFVRAFRDAHRKTSPYKLPVEYTFTEKSMTVCQGGEKTTLPWKSFSDAVITSSGISLYTEKSAYILPKKDVGAYYAIDDIAGREDSYEKGFCEIV